jgi:Cd2+/Zn2+-exporting ATPase
VERLQSELSRIQGVLSTAVHPTACATLHITYEAGLLTPSGLESEAQQIGAAIVARTDHQVITLRDLHCPDCAAAIEKQTTRLPGVLWAEVNFAAARIAVEYERNKITLDAICEAIGRHGVHACPTPSSLTEIRPETSASASPLRSWLTTHRREAETAIALVMVLLAALPVTLTNHPMDICLHLAGMLIAGRSVAKTAWQAARSHSIDMNVLVILAMVGAAGIGEWFEGTIVVVLFNIGNLLQSRAMEHTRRSISTLMKLSPSTARICRADGEEMVPVEQVRLHETVLVKPGERISMDGVILTGTSAVNEAPITGESLPVRKQPGDTVFGGTLNGSGALEFQVTHLFRDTTLARIIHWVEEAQARRAPAQQFIDRFARVYTPIVVGLAVAIALFPPLAALLWDLFHHAPAHPAYFSLWLSRALAMLLISCPCALVISTPVAIVTAIGSASRNGVLVKGGACLEAVARLRVLLYDKTGTLTTGHCQIAKVIPLDSLAEGGILEIASALEAKSEHPLAVAFTQAAHHCISSPLRQVTDFQAVPGEGVIGLIEGERYLLGSARLLRDHQVDMNPAQAALEQAEAAGKTAVLLSTLQKPLGLILIGDAPRPNGRTTVHELAGLGIVRQVMLTGDNTRAAKAVAQQVGIQEVCAQLLPEEKLTLVRTYRERYGLVGMVGDGINDAPALAAADVGIVMGAAGSATAMETADIALMSDNLSLLPYLIRLSRRMRAIVRQNVAFALLTKGLLLLIAVVAGIPLWLAVFGDVGVSLVVTLNALRLLDPKQDPAQTLVPIKEV